MKISVFTVMLPDMTPEEAAVALQEAGYDGVEWRVTVTAPERQQEAPSYWGNNLCTLIPTPEDAARARRLAESAGLAIPSLGSYIAMGDLGMVERVMEFARIAGAPQLRVGVGRTLDTHLYIDLFAQTRAFLAEVEPMARQYGVKALIETHPNTISPSASLAYRLVEGLDPDRVGVIYDPGNLVHEGYEDYRIGTQLLGPYLAHVHVKNGAFSRPERGGVWKPLQSPLEDGVVNFQALFAALKAAGYTGWLGVEDFSGVRAGRETLQHNIDYIRGALAALPR
ncbi:MAG: sugar phosphate isomerase/epimerase [Caldilineaceae bacterium]|nr:sugar phosphate isomerase/epimerase [Caldilineaceae bacterium]